MESLHYSKIKEDFNREATDPSGMFSKEWTTADWKIFNYLKEIVDKEWKVCELACGMCNVLEALDCYQYGLDLSEKMLAKCDIIHKYQGNFDDTSFGDKEFDLVFMAFGLQQSEDPKKTLKEAERIGKRVIIFDGDEQSSIGQERANKIATGQWPTCGGGIGGYPNWFSPSFFEKLGYEVDHILPHVLVAKRILDN